MRAMPTTPLDVSRDSDLIRLLSLQARARGEHGYAYQERTGKTRLTFAELDRKARAVACLLRAQHPQAQAAILCYPAGVEFLVGLFGSIYAGLSAAPAYPPRPRRADPRLEAIAGDLPHAVVLTTADLCNDKTRLTAQAPRLGNLPWFGTCGVDENSGAGFEPVPASDKRPVVLQYTSGSTSLPKGVMLTHACILHNLQRMQEVLGLGPDTHVLCWLPAFHDMGLIGNLLQAVHSGLDLTLLSPAAVAQEPLSWLEAIQREKAYVSGGPCFAFQHCLDRIAPAERERLDLSSWKVAYVGAEPVSPAVLERFIEFFAPCGFAPETFFPCYGLAEGSLMITGGDRFKPPVIRAFQPASLETTRPIPDESGRRLVACGRPLPDLDVRIVDPATLRPVADGDIGEIWVAGPSVAGGYWNRPDATAQTFAAQIVNPATGVAEPRHYLRTGDLGFLQDELFITGRLKELIIIRGRNYYPQDLEEAVAGISPLFGYHRGTAFTLDEGSRPRLILVQEVARAYKGGQGDELFRQARQVLAEQFDLELHTLVLVRTGSVPRASSGKIQRGETSRRFEAGTLEVVETLQAEPANGELMAPGEGTRSATALQIRDWLVRRLVRQLRRPADQIDIEQPFSHHGLDSMSMVTIAADLEKWLGRPLPQTLLYNAPTIARLAQLLAADMPIASSGDQPCFPQLLGPVPIAVIGLGCRFPHADGPDQFWQLLRAGRCVISELPPERWPHVPEDHAARQAGFLAEVRDFDAAFFGITPREAVYLDPQHRLLLEVAWETLEHAGLVPERLAGTEAGVFIGISTNDYGRMLLAGAAEPDPYIASGNALSMAAHRLSYHLDLRGPSMAVDTACSSSLVAVHLACQALRTGDCEIALAGGVNLILSGELSANLAQAQMLSPTGKCKTFDASADGYVRGEGCGMVVLKPLPAALRDGDRIYAVIEGSAVNQDGRSNGITAPNQAAQVEVIRKALRQAGRQPQEISYFEAHGTGTPLGDPIEFEALHTVLGSVSDKCALGAVKTNLGHLEAAAGIASLLKTILQLHHGELVPHLHVECVNPLIPLDGSRFYLPRSSEPWPESVARRAGVSAFGFGGANAHVIVAQAPQQTAGPSQVHEPEGTTYLLPLSARTDKALHDLAQRFAAWLKEHPDVPLGAACAAAARNRSHFPRRRAFLATTRAEMIAALQSDKICPAEGPASGERIAFLFTGQGAQYKGMGKCLLARNPVFRREMEHCAEVLRSLCSWSLFDVLDNEQMLERTDVAQPVLFALQVALARTWQAFGIEPAAVLGHSAGEYAAACVAGVFSLEDGLRLIVERGKGMQDCPEGAMLACFAPLAEIEEMIQPWENRLAVAALNGPENVVVAGDRAAVAELQAELFGRSRAARDLQVHRAFHSPLIEPALAALHRTAAAIQHDAPRLKFIANLTGTFRTAAPDADYWAEHARRPVQFALGMRTLHDAGFTHFVEIGPDPVLTRLGPLCVRPDAGVWLSSLSRKHEDERTILESLGRLYQDGAPVRWEAVMERCPAPALPTYPFDRKRYWFDGTPRPSFTPAQPPPAALEWLPLSHWGQALPRPATNLDRLAGGLAGTLVSLTGGAEQRERLQRFAQAGQQFDRLAADLILRTFANFGWQPQPGEVFRIDDIAQRYGVLPRYRRLLGRLVAIGGEEGWFLVQPETCKVRGLPALDDPQARQADFLKTFPEFEADWRLAQRCGTHLAGVLRGSDDPLNVLFGDDAQGLAERMYERSPVAAFYNDLLKRSLERLLANWPGDRPIRVLELGAGTGGTTAHVLPLFTAHRAEYVFTDVSPLFLAQAKEKFKDAPHLQFRLLDLESPPAAQGFASHQFDLVIASNVVHATSDLRRSVANIRKLLAPAGLLVLLEGTGPRRLLDLIFGLTDGWWKFADTDLRPDYPLLAQERWSRLLDEEHFFETVALPGYDATLDQAVILALSPGPGTETPVHQKDGHAARNGTARAPHTWLIAGDRSPLADLVGQKLRQQGDLVVRFDPQLPLDKEGDPFPRETSALVFGADVPASVMQRASFTWIVTQGQAPLGEMNTAGNLWSAQRLAQPRPQTCLIDLDPAEPAEAQARILLEALRHHDGQPVMAFRGSQRYVPQRQAAVAEQHVAKTLSGDDLRALPIVERRARLEAYMHGEFARVAGLVLTPEDQERPIQALGLDSLMAIQFRNRLEANLGVTLSVVDFLKGLSLNQLVENTLRRLGGAEEPSPATKPRGAPVPTFSPDKLDTLSEGELDSLLEALLE